MRARLIGILAMAMVANLQDTPKRALTITHNPQKRNSNKGKQKQHKSKASVKYKSSKPLKSKAVSQHRNKSNI